MTMLRIKSGVNTGKVFEITGEALVLGREATEGQRSLQVLDQGVSRRHAEIFRIGEMFFIRDLESRNGTFVNEEAVNEAVLRLGDQIRLGNTVLVFEDRSSRRFDSRQVVMDDGALGAGQGKAPVASPSHTIHFAATQTIGVRDRAGPASGPSRSLEVLYQVSHIIGEEKDLSRILTRCADLIGKTLDADNVFILGRKGQNGTEEFEILARHDHSSEFEEAGVSRSIIRDCIEHTRSVLTSDAGLDSRFNAMASVVMKGIKSVMCVPISSLGKTLGVLYLANSRKAEAFRTEDLELASAVGIQLGITLQLLRLIGNSDQFFRNSIRTLVSAIEMRDPARKGCAQRVATYSLAIARELGWNTAGIKNAWLAGMLHDIGSIPLSDQDREAKFLTDTKKNFYAREILKDSPGLEEILPAVLQHGERWDGSGKPESKKGEAIPALARVLGLAVEFDRLLTHGGPDGKELTVREALLKTRDLADKTFDRTTVNALLIAYRNGSLFNTEAGFFLAPTGA